MWHKPKDITKSETDYILDKKLLTTLAVISELAVCVHSDHFY